MGWLKRLFRLEPAKANGSGSTPPMISCAEALERLYELLDQELDDTWEQRVRMHFEACAACGPAFRFERAFLGAIHGVEVDTETPAEVRSRILRVLAEEGLDPV